MAMGKKIFIMLSLVALIWAGCSNEVEPPNGASDLPAQPETPRGLTASIGNGQIVLKWAVTDEAAISKYVVYYSDSAATDMLVFDTTVHLTDTIDGLVNGRRYYFRVAAIDNANLQGVQSTPITGVPGIFSILIENGAKYTNTREVTITITAPDGTGLVRLSEDPEFADAHWSSFTGGKPFDLSDKDTVKTVYAQFELEAGGSSVDVISDDIILDRSSVIDSFKVYVNEDSLLSGAVLLADGLTMRFEIYVHEEGSNASVNITDLGTITLNDYGVGGDRVAGDRIYGGYYIIPDGTEVTNNVLKARFTDAADNLAPEFQSNVRLSVESIPPPVDFWGFAASSSEVQLVWSPTQIVDFSRYRLFRSRDDFADDSTLITQIITKTDSKFFDTGLDEQTGYSYALYVDDYSGHSSRSLSGVITTLPNEPPDTLTIMATSTGDSTSAQISWLTVARADDFKAYFILRNTDTLPTYNDTDYTSYPEEFVIKFLIDQQLASYVDVNVPDTGLYYYQVYVIDQQGMVSRSNQDTVRVP